MAAGCSEFIGNLQVRLIWMELPLVTSNANANKKYEYKS